jgi:tetratricopeptide (TPR) repeat protein
MRWMLRPVLTWLILTVVPIGGWCQIPEGREISGRLIFENNPDCELVPVELEMVAMQPVATAHTDTSCNFKFSRVQPGSYMIHVNIDGYQEVRMDVEYAARFGVLGAALIPMTPAPGRLARATAKSGGSPVVDVTELKNQYPKKAVDLFNKAVNSAKKGRYDDAVSKAESALRIAPNFYQAHNSLGLFYRQVGQLDKAEEHFVRAHEINSRSADPLINLGGLYLQENRPVMAEQTSEKAVAANSRSAPALFNLGVSLYRLAKLDQAEKALLKALAIAPKMFQIRLALANVYLKLSRYDNLMEQLNTYLAENPDGAARDQVEHLRERLLNPARPNQQH